MKILIVSATSLEIRPLIQALGEGERINEKRVAYRYKGHHIDVLTTGVGMVATSFWLGKTLTENRYQLLINTGIAGAFNRDLALGSTTWVWHDTLPEMGAEDGESFLSLIDLDLLEDDDFPFSGGEIEAETSIVPEVLNTLPKVISATVNKVHGNEASIEEFTKRHSADIESMEGAAFLYAAKVNQVDNIQLRAISNYVEQRDRSNWQIPEAVHSLCRTTLKLIDQL
jgi:futalosine hydrolase